MALDGKILAKARQQLESIHADNVAEHFLRQDRIYSRIPEIERIDLRLRSQMSELVGLTIRKAPDLAEALKALESESLELQAKKAELLKEHGYGIDYLDDIYSCPKCKDTGFVQGNMCSCLKELYNRELTSELSVLLRSGNER